MNRAALEEGEYRVMLVSRKDGSTYLAYFRCLYTEDSIGHAVFVDDTGARVSMLPRYAAAMRPLSPNEKHPEIDLDIWRGTYIK
jgi:hypothetical protein